MEYEPIVRFAMLSFYILHFTFYISVIDKVNYAQPKLRLYA